MILRVAGLRGYSPHGFAGGRTRTRLGFDQTLPHQSEERPPHAELQKASGLRSHQHLPFAPWKLSRREYRFAWLYLCRYVEEQRAACTQAMSEEGFDES